MLKVFRINDFDATKHHKEQYRRGFVVPYDDIRRKVLFITDGDLDHERLADNFIAMTDEQIRDVIMEQGIVDENDFNTTFNEIKRLQKGYQKKKETYPTSRKDYLLYEEGAIAYDAKSIYGKFILYRDNSRKYSMSRDTENITFGYVMNGWKGKPIPDNCKQAQCDNPWEREF